MAKMIVAYDLNKIGQNYTCITEKLKKLTSFHAQQSVWLVKYNGTAAELRDHLSPCCDTNDKLFVAQFDEKWASYYMPDAAKWLNG